MGKTCSRAGRSLVEKTFDLRVQTAKLERIYEETILAKQSIAGDSPLGDCLTGRSSIVLPRTRYMKTEDENRPNAARSFALRKAPEELFSRLLALQPVFDA